MNEEKVQNRNDFDEHHRKKWRVRQPKADHKDLARNNPDRVAAIFDLEQVLLCPKLAVSSLFYRRSWQHAISLHTASLTMMLHATCCMKDKKEEAVERLLQLWPNFFRLCRIM